jgi:hypothetical protein
MEREASAPKKGGGGVFVPDGGRPAGHAEDGGGDTNSGDAYLALPPDADPALEGAACSANPIAHATKPPEEVLRVFGILRRGVSEPGAPALSWSGPVKQLFVEHTRLVSAERGRIAVAPAMIGCAHPVPGACLGWVDEGGAELSCATLTQLGRRGLALRAEGRNGVAFAVLVPDGVHKVRMESGKCGTRTTLDIPVEDNIAAMTLLTHLRCAEIVALLRD